MGGYANPMAEDLGHSSQAEAERQMTGVVAAEVEAPGSIAVVGCCSAKTAVADWSCRLCCSESVDPNLALVVEEPDSRSRKNLV